MDDPLKITRNGAVLEIVLERPKANAIDAATSRELSRVFVAFRDDPDLRVAVLTGVGDRFFSAGWDLGAAADGEDFEADYGEGGFGGFCELPNRHKPVICAVNGMAVGGGFEIAMAAEFVLAADHATFFLPETGLGIIPDAGVIRLPRQLPAAVANEVLYGGRRLGAAEAERRRDPRLLRRPLSGRQPGSPGHDPQGRIHGLRGRRGPQPHHGPRPGLPQPAVL